MRTVILDLIACGWLTAIATVAYALLPVSLIRTRPWRSTMIVAGCCSSLLVTVVGAAILARFHLLNWATACVLAFGWPLSVFCVRAGRLADVAFVQLSR